MFLFCKYVKKPAKTKQVINVPIVELNPNTIPNAIPNKLLWDKDHQSKPFFSIQ